MMWDSVEHRCGVKTPTYPRNLTFFLKCFQQWPHSGLKDTLQGRKQSVSWFISLVSDLGNKMKIEVKNLTADVSNFVWSNENMQHNVRYEMNSRWAVCFRPFRRCSIRKSGAWGKFDHIMDIRDSISRKWIDLEGSNSMTFKFSRCSTSASN
jgi:hypothetical protein